MPGSSPEASRRRDVAGNCSTQQTFRGPDGQLPWCRAGLRLGQETAGPSLSPCPIAHRLIPFWEVTLVASWSWYSLIHLSRTGDWAGGLAFSGKAGKGQEAGNEPHSQGLKLSLHCHPLTKDTGSCSHRALGWRKSSDWKVKSPGPKSWYPH